MASTLITFRETLEAGLVVGIVLAYLQKIRQADYNRYVYYGVGAALIASFLGAFLFQILAGGFEGRAEEIFEGVVMLIGATLLTTMILWMMQQRQVAQEIQQKVAVQVNQAHKWGLFLLVFFAVFREGIETVIFLGAASASEAQSFSGGLLGVFGAIFLAYLLFSGARQVNVKTFFNVTSLLLILFAAGLVAHGVHELQEAKVLPVLVEHVWDINPQVNLDGSFPPLHEKGSIGIFLKAMFGYNGNPSLLEVLSYAAYLGGVALLWRKLSRPPLALSSPEPARSA